MNNITIVIPARYNSTRFMGKPLILIDGKTMLKRVYEIATEIQGIDSIYVATEDSRILNYCLENSMPCIMTSKDHKMMLSRISEFARVIDSRYYLIINGDEPLLEAYNIQKITRNLIDSTEHRIEVRNLISQIVNEHINIGQDTTDIKVVFNRCNDIIYMSRGLIPNTKSSYKPEYFKHVGCYLMNREALSFFESTPTGLLEDIEDIDLLRFIENGIKVKAIIVETEAISVDLKEDVSQVQRIIETKKFMIND